ncbi:MAG: YciI family protein [Gammaproteobacteria bacterium]
MFIVIVSYSKSPEMVKPYFKEHCEWLHKHIKLGNFVASGPKKNNLGGAFLARSMEKKDLQKIIEEDSYFTADVADYLIVDMDFKLAAQGFEKLIS